MDDVTVVAVFLVVIFAVYVGIGILYNGDKQ
jgi:hypothetical protein